MTDPHSIDRNAAEAKGYPTTSAADFELAEHIRYLVGDPGHLHRSPNPPAAPMAQGAQSSHVGAGV